MSKTQYFDRVSEFKKENPLLTHKEACHFISDQIKQEKEKSKAKQPKQKIGAALSEDQNIACIRCGYEITDPGTAFVCAACGIQN